MNTSAYGIKKKMKKKCILFLFTIALVSGCSINQSRPNPLEIQSDSSSQHNNSPANLPTESAGASQSIEEATPNENEQKNDYEKFLSSNVTQKPYEVISDNIIGYHDLITDVHETNLNLDMSDPRLSGLIKHLCEYDYNFTLNQIAEISSPASLYVLADKLNHLPADYVPDHLREPDVRFSFDGANEKRNLRDEAASGLEQMFAKAKEDDIYLFAVSGYRSYNRQQVIYNAKVNDRGKEKADEVSARPGHSEHQTGLAMDISSESVGYGLEYEFGDTKEGIWTAEHAHEYGFIIRYPSDQVPITGYNYEPWHLRYVGPDLADYIYENQLTVEELYASLLNQIKALRTEQ